MPRIWIGVLHRSSMHRSIFRVLRFSISVFLLASFLCLLSIRYVLFIFPCSFFHLYTLLDIYSSLQLGILGLLINPFGYYYFFFAYFFFCRILFLISSYLSTFCYFLFSFLQYLLHLLVFLFFSPLLLNHLRMQRLGILFHWVLLVGRWTLLETVSVTWRLPVWLLILSLSHHTLFLFLFICTFTRLSKPILLGFPVFLVFRIIVCGSQYQRPTLGRWIVSIAASLTTFHICLLCILLSWVGLFRSPFLF